MFTHSKLTAHRLTQQSVQGQQDSLVGSGDTQPKYKELCSGRNPGKPNQTLGWGGFSVGGEGEECSQGLRRAVEGLSIGGMGVGRCTPGFRGAPQVFEDGPQEPEDGPQEEGGPQEAGGGPGLVGGPQELSGWTPGAWG